MTDRETNYEKIRETHQIENARQRIKYIDETSGRESENE